MTELPISEAREKLGELANRAAYTGDRVVLTRHGRAIAALVPMQVLRDIEAAEDAADLDAIRRAREEVDPNVPHSEVIADLVEDEATERRGA